MEGGDVEALNVLSTWSVLEALSPRTYREPRDLAEGMLTTVGPLRKDRLPWHEPGEPREHYAFYHRISLGGIDMRKASRALVDVYGQDEGREGARAEQAVIAMLLVDARGVPLSKGHSVSSFGWALPLVLGKDLSKMERWSLVEEAVLQHVSGLLVRESPDGTMQPIEWDDVLKAHAYIVKRFAIPEDFVSPPSFSLRVEHRRRGRSEPQPYLLNSFYLADLDAATDLVDKGEAPQALRSYLGVDEPRKAIDVLASRQALGRMLSPAVTPRVRWPSPSGSPLVTLQQAATNAALGGLGAGEGVLAVNGPPGTGKTTLLRDVVAGCILARAEAMAAFENPDDAFVKDALPADKPVGRRPWRLRASLRGHEVLVASSNNKAVENVSRELPFRKAVGRPDLPLSHMRVTADALAGITADPARAHENEGRERCWGLVSAALGNSENRHRFMQTFWWDDDHSVRTWLRLARGDSVTVHVKDKKGKVIQSRPPFMLADHDGPRKAAESLNRWRRVRGRFLELRRTVEDELGRLEGYERAILATHTLAGELDAAQAEADRMSDNPSDADTLVDRHASVEAAYLRAEAAMERHLANEPRRDDGPSVQWTVWDADREGMLNEIQGLSIKRARLAGAVRSLRPVEGGNGALLSVRGRVSALEEALEAAQATVTEMLAEVGDRTVDQAYFGRGHASWNLATPWMTERVQRLREDLFHAAMEVHTGFVAASAGRVLQNLACFAETMGQAGTPLELDDYLGDLWSTVFMVVPVLSTTFASVGRMLEGLKPGTLGWLVVDEAGQAMPQAAVGALTRCRRALVVGDPLQIEPVDPLPRRLASRICAHFDVQPRTWVGPYGSVQSIADRSSPLQAILGEGDSARLVGMPLLVHRRCQEPMFGISNRIAYDEQMVFASGDPVPGPVARTLGASAWFDVTGEHESKWCPEQGETVVGLLDALAAARADRPDVYVISPFREVASGLQRRLQRETLLFQAIGEDPVDWVRSRVGTIHTFQGREAEAVILVLGAGDPSHAPARNWAGSSPNILNVAVSRAKLRLYVVGDRGAWADAGAFSFLTQVLDASEPPQVGRGRSTTRRAVLGPGIASIPRQGAALH